MWSDFFALHMAQLKRKQGMEGAGMGGWGGYFWVGELRCNPELTASEEVLSWRKTENLNNLIWETEMHKHKKKESWNGKWEGGGGEGERINLKKFLHSLVVCSFIWFLGD